MSCRGNERVSFYLMRLAFNHKVSIAIICCDVWTVMYLVSCMVALFCAYLMYLLEFESK